MIIGIGHANPEKFPVNGNVMRAGGVWLEQHQRLEFMRGFKRRINIYISPAIVIGIQEINHL